MDRQNLTTFAGDEFVFEVAGTHASMPNGLIKSEILPLLPALAPCVPMRYREPPSSSYLISIPLYATKESGDL